MTPAFTAVVLFINAHISTQCVGQSKEHQSTYQDHTSRFLKMESFAMANLPKSKYKTITTIFFLLILFPAHLDAAASDIFGPSTAVTSRYWDCCKPSCSWTIKADFNLNHAVTPCDAHSNPLSDYAQASGCQGGTSFACPSNSPWAVNDTFSYGFVGAFLRGGDESTWCCGCYQLNFTSGPVKGKSMIVQASNTDYNIPDNNVFTFGIPGGNTSYAGACAIQYGVPNATFGAENVGVSTRSDCDNLPAALKPGCYWRFDWLKDAEGPTVDYKRVQCPAALTNISGCARADDDTFQKDADSQSKSSAAALFLLPSVTSSAIGVLLFTWILQGQV